jgi:hypothetical protein
MTVDVPGEINHRRPLAVGVKEARLVVRRVALGETVIVVGLHRSSLSYEIRGRCDLVDPGVRAPSVRSLRHPRRGTASVENQRNRGRQTCGRRGTGSALHPGASDELRTRATAETRIGSSSESAAGDRDDSSVDDGRPSSRSSTQPDRRLVGMRRSSLRMMGARSVGVDGTRSRATASSAGRTHCAMSSSESVRRPYEMCLGPSAHGGALLGQSTRDVVRRIRQLGETWQCSSTKRDSVTGRVLSGRDGDPVIPGNWFPRSGRRASGRRPNCWRVGRWGEIRPLSSSRTGETQPPAGSLTGRD